MGASVARSLMEIWYRQWLRDGDRGQEVGREEWVALMASVAKRGSGVSLLSL